ncbi:MAG: MATE family efflux transporter [Prevotella sp.]|nr:MATE family efflux transporter [Prevotella sp.]
MSVKKSDLLLAKIRDGAVLTNNEKLRLIISLSIPSILAQLTTTLMFFIDAAMVGSLGASASASVGIVETTLWLFFSVANACTIGFGVQVANAIGANDFKRARRVMRTGIVTSLLVSVTLCIIGIAVCRRLPFWLGAGADIAGDASIYFLIYVGSVPLFQLNGFFANMLKSSGNMRTPSALNILSCVLDVVFNFLCIYPTRTVSFLSLNIPLPGLGLGVAGAALGSAIAIVVTVILMAHSALFRSPILALKHDAGDKNISWRPDFSVLRRMIKISSPLAAQYCLMNGAQMVSTMIVAPLGNFAIAANNFAVNAEALCYMPGFGIADAGTTLVGQSIGARRFDLCKSLAYRCVAAGMIVMAFMGFIMYVAAPELMGLMTPVPEIVSLGAQALRIEAFAEPMFAAAIICSSCMVGAGDTAVPAAMNLLTMWGIRLTIAAWLAPIWGLAGAWTGMAVELTLRGIIFLIRLIRGSWLKKSMLSAELKV